MREIIDQGEDSTYIFVEPGFHFGVVFPEALRSNVIDFDSERLCPELFHLVDVTLLSPIVLNGLPLKPHYRPIYIGLLNHATWTSSFCRHTRFTTLQEMALLNGYSVMVSNKSLWRQHHQQLGIG